MRSGCEATKADAALRPRAFLRRQSGGLEVGYTNGNGLHAELSSAMARTESSQRRAAFLRTSRSQLDLRRTPIGLKDLVRLSNRDIFGSASGNGGGDSSGVRVLHSYTLI